MKIYINRKPVNGAWGGGNRYVKALVYSLSSRGHSICYNLNERNIEKYVCFDPRPNESGEDYDRIYSASRETGGKIVQRVGDIGSHGKPALRKMVELSVQKSDEVIFVSEWARRAINYKGEYHLIYNYPVANFIKARRPPRQIEGRVKVLTHHWSDNPMKGFDTYRALDKWIGENGEIEFTYCGRWPSNLPELRNSKHIGPIDGTMEIAELIASSDLYLTASLSEPSGNHAIEAKFTGVPVLYNSLGGGIAEYCKGYGAQYSNIQGLIKLIKEWSDLDLRMKNFEKVSLINSTVQETISRYIEVIEGD